MKNILFKMLFKDLFKNSFHLHLNIIMLVLGYSMFLILLSYYSYETSYDSFIKNYNNIYSVRSIISTKNTVKRLGTVPPGVGTHLLEYPEVKKMVRIVKGDNIPLKYKDLTINNNTTFYVDSTFFSVFSFPFKYGNARDAFKNPNSVILTESAAKKFFGDKNGMGEIIRGVSIFSDTLNIVVSGIIKDIPLNSHLKFDILISMDVRYKSKVWKFIGGGAKLDNIFYFGSDNTYVLLDNNVNVNELENKMPKFIDKYIGAQRKNKNNFPDDKWEIKFQPLNKIHLYSDYETNEDFINVTNNSKTITFLFTFVLFILFFTLLNFSNYFILNSINNKKNYIIRYLQGETKGGLLTFLILKNVVINLIAILTTIVIFTILSPQISRLFKVHIIFNSQFYKLISISSIIILVTILIPSFLSFLSLSFSGNLKNKNNNKLFSIWNLSFIFQFSLAIIIIISSIIVQFQYNFILGKNIGIDTKNVIVLSTLLNKPNLYNSFKAELLKNPNIESVSGNHYRIGNKNRNVKDFKINRTGEIVSGEKNKIDIDFPKTFNIQLAEGRFLNRDDIWKILINETAVKEWGFKSNQAALHEFLTVTYSGTVVEIVGVYKDYHQRDLKNRIPPLVMIPFTSFNQTALYTYIKVKPQNTKETLNYIQKTWNMFYDKSVFNFQFADQIIANMNSDTIILRNLLGLLLIVTIISVCFGIYSISSFTVKIKTNEAVIRKIHGSSNFQIVKLISYAYLKNITISLIISIPTAYYISMNIISNYAYRIDFPFKAFIYSFFIMLIIVFITISSLIIRISKANPVEVLKEE